MAEEVEMTPITPAEGGSVPPKVSPFGAPPAAPAAAGSAAAAAGASTIKLKPVIRKPMIHKPTIGAPKPMTPVAPVEAPAPAPAVAPLAAAKPAAPAATPAGVPPTLKRATQNLKSVTGPIPVQATLRKTGIIAEGIITPAQQQAAKSKTSRISLESAIGVAPAKEGPAPLKTIRLRRPADLKPPAALTPAGAAPAPAPEAAAPVPAPAPAMTSVEPAPMEPDASDTQKKTMKLHRPGAAVGIKKPTLGIKKPEATAPETGDVGDIPDMPIGDLKPLAPVAAQGTCAGVPKGVAVVSMLATLAALLVIGAVVYFLYTEGVGADAGANAMPFIQA